MVAYARGSPCRQPSRPGGPIAAGARYFSLLKVVNTGAPKIPHHESWSPGDACTKPRRAFNSLLEKEPKSGKALAGPARPGGPGPSGHQLDPNRTSPPALPHAALGYYDNGSAGCGLAHENGLTAAANPWGCPPPGGGVRAAFEPLGRFPRAWKKPVVVVDAPGDPRNLGRRFCVHPLECSNAVVRGRRGAEPERTPIAAATTSVCSLSTATREVVGGDGHQCSLFRGYQSLDTLAAAPERDADHGAASAPDL